MIKKSIFQEIKSNYKLTKGYEIIILVMLFSIAFITRMMTYNSIFVGDKIRFLEFDPYYHMRRAISFAENLQTWNFDTYLNYPYGNIVGWPILFDLSIALVANIIGLGNPSRHLIETVGVYLPVFLGSLSVIVVYFVAKEIFTVNNDNSNNIHNDEQVSPVVSKKDRKTKKGKRVQENRNSLQKLKNIEPWQIGLGSAFLLAIIPAFVQVSFLGFTDHHVAEVLLSSLAFLFFIRALKAKDVRNKYISLVLMIIILIMAMLVWLGTPIFIGIILIYGIVQCIIDKKYKYLLLIIGALIVFYVGAYFIVPDTYNTLNQGIGFLTRDRIELTEVREMQPLFVTTNGKLTLEPAWYAFNMALYIGIISIFILLIGVIKSIKNNSIDIVVMNRVKIFFLVWTLITMVLNIYQSRFIYLFAVNIVILCSYLIVQLVNSEQKYTKVLGIVFIVIILVPSINMVNMMSERPIMLSNDWFESSEWLKNNTPDTNSSWNMPSKDVIPSYGIMSWWDYGNYILYLSERPVVANNFQLGAEDAARFYGSENITESNEILNKRRVKYVVLDYTLGLNTYNIKNRVVIGGAWASVAIMQRKDIKYYMDKRNMPNDKYLNTTYAKLYVFDGKGLENKYKLVYKSGTHYSDIFGKPIEEIKIFEYMG